MPTWSPDDVAGLPGYKRNPWRHSIASKESSHVDPLDEARHALMVHGGNHAAAMRELKHNAGKKNPNHVFARAARIVSRWWRESEKVV